MGYVLCDKGLTLIRNTFPVFLLRKFFNSISSFDAPCIATGIGLYLILRKQMMPMIQRTQRNIILLNRLFLLTLLNLSERRV